MKLIRVVAKKDGSVSVETSGYSGKACLKATEALEQELGIDGARRTLTPEFHAPVRDTTATREG